MPNVSIVGKCPYCGSSYVGTVSVPEDSAVTAAINMSATVRKPATFPQIVCANLACKQAFFVQLKHGPSSHQTRNT